MDTIKKEQRINVFLETGTMVYRSFPDVTSCLDAFMFISRQWEGDSKLLQLPPDDNFNKITLIPTNIVDYVEFTGITNQDLDNYFSNLEEK